VFATQRVIIGVTSEFIQLGDGSGSSGSGGASGGEEEYVFLYDVQVNNARPEAVELQGRHWDMIDSTGAHTVAESGEGLGGAKKHGVRRLGPGEAFRWQGVVRSPTPEANLLGWIAFEVLPAEGQPRLQKQQRARIAPLGLSHRDAPVKPFIDDQAPLREYGNHFLRDVVLDL
jgi:uncharacterized protein affecting Mg2+/Co2+ transport